MNDVYPTSMFFESVCPSSDNARFWSASPSCASRARKHFVDRTIESSPTTKRPRPRQFTPSTSAASPLVGFGPARPPPRDPARFPPAAAAGKKRPFAEPCPTTSLVPSCAPAAAASSPALAGLYRSKKTRSLAVLPPALNDDADVGQLPVQPEYRISRTFTPHHNYPMVVHPSVVAASAAATNHCRALVPINQERGLIRSGPRVPFPASPDRAKVLGFSITDTIQVPDGLILPPGAKFCGELIPDDSDSDDNNSDRLFDDDDDDVYNEYHNGSAYAIDD